LHRFPDSPVPGLVPEFPLNNLPDSAISEITNADCPGQPFLLAVLSYHLHLQVVGFLNANEWYAARDGVIDDSAPSPCYDKIDPWEQTLHRRAVDNTTLENVVTHSHVFIGFGVSVESHDIVGQALPLQLLNDLRQLGIPYWCSASQYVDGLAWSTFWNPHPAPCFFSGNT